MEHSSTTFVKKKNPGENEFIESDIFRNRNFKVNIISNQMVFVF